MEVSLHCAGMQVEGCGNRYISQRVMAFFKNVCKLCANCVQTGIFYVGCMCLNSQFIAFQIRIPKGGKEFRSIGKEILIIN